MSPRLSSATDILNQLDASSTKLMRQLRTTRAVICLQLYFLVLRKVETDFFYYGLKQADLL